MKTIKMEAKHYFYILLATLALASCGQRPLTTVNQDPNTPIYYAYNPEDTIGNKPYWWLLRIDSARVEFRLNHPVNEMPIINLDSSGGAEKTLEQLQHDNSILVAETEAKWFELMRLCSQRQYEDALSLYIKEQTDIGIALATSTNKFELDSHVIVKFLFDYLDWDEAKTLFVGFLEYDIFLTESVIAFSTADGGSGYIPTQYAYQIEYLCSMYVLQHEWEKAEALLEPHRKAVYLLSDDTLANEIAITDLKFNMYQDMGNSAKVKEAFVEYREFLIQYAKDTHQDLDEQIETMDALIKKVE